MNRHDEWLPHRLDLVTEAEDMLFLRGKRSMNKMLTEIIKVINGSNTLKKSQEEELKRVRVYIVGFGAYSARETEYGYAIYQKDILIGLIPSKYNITVQEGYDALVDDILEYLVQRKAFRLTFGVRLYTVPNEAKNLANIIHNYEVPETHYDGIEKIYWKLPIFDEDKMAEYKPGEITVEKDKHDHESPYIFFHEIGHNVSRLKFKVRFSKNKKKEPKNDLAQEWLTVAGWIKGQDYPEDLYQRENTEASESGVSWWQLKTRQNKLRNNGRDNPEEDFAVSYGFYVTEGLMMKQQEPRRYEFMRDKIFKGVEFSRDEYTETTQLKEENDKKEEKSKPKTLEKSTTNVNEEQMLGLTSWDRIGVSKEDWDAEVDRLAQKEFYKAIPDIRERYRKIVDVAKVNLSGDYNE